MAHKPKRRTTARRASKKKNARAIPRGWWVGAAHLYEPSKKSLREEN